MSEEQILAIDTALFGCNAGVRRADGEVFTAAQAMARGQAEALVPMVQGVMSEAGVAFEALSAVATTIGPGAFTGLRIGLSTARSFGLALDIPVIGLTTFEVLAHQYEEKNPCAVIIETKRDDFYVQVFGADKTPLSEPQALPGEAVAALLASYKDAVLIGDAVERFVKETGVMHMCDKSVNAPDPAVMLILARKALKSGSVTAPEPLYLRGADVSERKTPLRVLSSS